MPRYIVGITGASGVIYGIRLLEVLLRQQAEVHLVVTNPARIVIEHELKWDMQGDWKANLCGHLPEGNITVYDDSDIAAPIASGSFRVEGMLVVPCTMASIAGLASGYAHSLLERAADVMLKEKKPLLLVPRETPLSSIHLRNMLVLAEAGAHIIPAMPAFYTHPATVEDMVDFVVGKVLDALGVEHHLFKRYGEL